MLISFASYLMFCLIFLTTLIVDKHYVPNIIIDGLVKVYKYKYLYSMIMLIIHYNNYLNLFLPYLHTRKPFHFNCGFATELSLR